jgi:putative pyruvate formate lyase activating enzyme
LAGYVKLYKAELLKDRYKLAQKHLRQCYFCAHGCGINRLAEETGFCRAGELAEVASYGPHPGEEAVLVGRRGSGTIFFSRCTLNCSFCQNWDISQRAGTTLSNQELAEIMMELQARGCENINLVSPTHYLVPILGALCLAVEQGLALPLVWNSGGYDSALTMQLLAGVVDIWLPDMKFWNPEIAWEITGARNYPEINRRAVARMYAQSGRLQIKDGVAVSGLIVRHLVLPGELAGSEGILTWLAEHVDRSTAVNVMGQYHPCYKARKHGELARPVTEKEVAKVVGLARGLGLNLV